jgi:membrane associated rhomboid family serine protease
MFQPLLRSRGAPLLRSSRLLRLNDLTPLTAIRTAAHRRTPLRPRPAPIVVEPPRPPPEIPNDWRRIEAESYPEEEDNDADAKACNRLMFLFLLIAVPSTLAIQFPTRLLPPVPDPPELSYLSGKPLNLGTWIRHPWDAAQILVFRLRRGEYVKPIRDHMSFSAFNYMELPLPGQTEAEKWRWWTWGTYLFLHGSPVHLFCCTVAMHSLVRLLVPQYGVRRIVALWAGSGIGAAAITTKLEVWRHGEAVKRGEGIQVEIRQARLPTGERVAQKVVSVDPVYKHMFAANLGSSAGLMGLMSVVAVTMPQTTWGLLFLPMQIPSRFIFSGLITWDLLCSLGILPEMGIAHEGHLAGAAVGMLLYAAWMRRLPVSHALWRLRKKQGYW